MKRVKNFKNVKLYIITFRLRSDVIDMSGGVDSYGYNLDRIKISAMVNFA